MATRQYIGARYVPKFFENSATGDSTWASNTTYEPLTMVMWNSVVYTSKKYVPASVGNPAENPTYWVATSNASEQIAQLAEQVATLEGTVEDVSDSVDDIEGKFESNGALKVSAGGTGGTTSNAACANIGAVKKAGDTMTGNLQVESDSDAKVIVKNGVTDAELQLASTVSGTHGLLSPGFYDGTNFASDNKWLARRAPVSGNFVFAQNVALLPMAVAGNGTINLAFPSAINHGFVFVTGAGANTHGIASIDTNNAGEVTNASVMVAASSIAITYENNVVSIKNNTASYIYLVYIGCFGTGPAIN